MEDGRKWIFKHLYPPRRTGLIKYGIKDLEKRNDLRRTIILLRRHAGMVAGGSGLKIDKISSKILIASILYYSILYFLAYNSSGFLPALSPTIGY